MVGKILICDDVATNRIVLKVKLGAACYQPVVAADGRSCLAMAAAEGPDVILLDWVLPDMAGLEVLGRLRSDPRTAAIPVIVLSALPDREGRLAALRAGADDFLAKPVCDQVLLARLRNLLRQGEETGFPPLAREGAGGPAAMGLAEPAPVFEHPGLVALVTARPERALRWRHDLLSRIGGRVMLMSREAALAGSAPGAIPDVYVIEADLGEPLGGLRLMSDLHSRTATRHSAICMVQPDRGDDSAAMVFDLGANDLVPPDCDPQELALRLRNLMRRKRRADRIRASVETGLRLAVIDPLTGLYNRRYGLARLGAMAAEDEGSLALMVLDLDRFKAVNDGWGHPAGDAVLVEVARRLLGDLRPQDLLARIGGEEFLVALAETTLPEARRCAERLCQRVQEAPIPLPGGAGALNVTISIGLAVSEGTGAAPEERARALIAGADAALMSAKAEGRNQVMLSRSAA